MYNCSKCGLGVLVKDLPSPIRACNCKILVERKPVTRLEKFKHFFGVKFYNTKNAPIIMSMDVTLTGNSKLNT